MTKVTFTNARNLTIQGVMDSPESTHKAVIISHGFLSFKEYKLLHSIAQSAVQNGICALRFDFTGCTGESDGGCEDILVSHNVDTLRAAVDFMHTQGYTHIGLVGHSLGGLTSLILASIDSRINAVVSIAAPANVSLQNLVTPDMVSAWKQNKKHTFHNQKIGSVEINFHFYKDFEEYDVTALAHKIYAPTRIIHGSEDTVVPVTSAKAIFNSLSGEKNLEIVDGADHLFLKAPYLARAVHCTVEWLQKL